MPSIHLRHVSFGYSDAVPLIQDLDVEFSRGWYGIAGANGAGKTTLLRLLSGALEPDQGEIVYHPSGASVLYCPQEVEALTPEVDAFAADTSGLARRLAGQLELAPADLGRWPTLSPGERKRWQVGAALAAEPLLLLLDEPTNHLDADARDVLVASLADWRGIGLLVSHDRALLNALPAHTLRLHERRVEVLRGAYDEARRTWEREERERRARWDKLRGEQRKLGRRIADRRSKQAHAQARMRKKNVMKGPKDNDARAKLGAKRRRSAEVSLGREIHKAHDEKQRIESQLDEFSFKKGVGRALFVGFTRAPRRELLSLVTPALCAGDKTLLRDVRVLVARDSRIRVAGPNGIGKTTLLRALLERSRLPPGRLLWLPQEQTEAEDVALLDELRAAGPDERSRVLTLVAALGVHPEPLLASLRPSPGEARKLAMAFAMARQVWGLVVDEPTNHLDLPSIERLEAALAEYPGALVMVTHDDHFARRLTSTTWQLRDGRVHVR